LTGSHKKEPGKSTLQSRPATADTQQVTGFEKQQALIQKSDAQNAQLQQAIAGWSATRRGQKAFVLSASPRSGHHAASCVADTRFQFADAEQPGFASVECCRGTRPNQAARSRPFLKLMPFPIAATSAGETMGPKPGRAKSTWHQHARLDLWLVGRLHDSQ